MKYFLISIFIIAFLTVKSQETVQIPDIPGDLMIDVGLNYWSEESDSIQQKGWPSKSIGLYFVNRKPLGQKLSFMYGIGFGLDKIDLGNTHTLYSSKDSVYVGALPFDSTFSVNKNRLASTYLDVPLELRFHPTGTQDGEGLFIGVGGIIGLMLNAHSRWKYEEGGEDVVQKISGRYDLNTIRYGAQFRFGFKGIHFFYKQYFSNFFRDPVLTEGTSQRFNPTMATFGINVTGF